MKKYNQFSPLTKKFPAKKALKIYSKSFRQKIVQKMVYIHKKSHCERQYTVPNISKKNMDY